MLTKEQRKYLSSIYFDPANPAAFSGIDKTWKLIKAEGKVTKKQLYEWLREQDTYTAYFPLKRNFKRPRTISPRVNAFWGSDVAYMLPFAEHNDNYGYFAVFIDVFSRYVYAEPMKNLRGKTMYDVMKSVFEKDKPKALYTDSGSEYTNKVVQTFLKQEKVTVLNLLAWQLVIPYDWKWGSACTEMTLMIIPHQ